METLNRVHEVQESRSWRHRFPRSIALAVAATVLVFVAVVLVRFAPGVAGDGLLGVLAQVLRWPAAAGVLALAVGLLIHFGPDCADQPLAYVSFGAALTVLLWLAMSALFGVYLTQLASYGSVFGFLATFVVLTGYLYASCIVFVAGVQLDALVRTDEPLEAGLGPGGGQPARNASVARRPGTARGSSGRRPRAARPRCDGPPGAREALDEALALRLARRGELEALA